MKKIFTKTYRHKNTRYSEKQNSKKLFVPYFKWKTQRLELIDFYNLPDKLVFPNWLWCPLPQKTRAITIRRKRIRRSKREKNLFSSPSNKKFRIVKSKKIKKIQPTGEEKQSGYNFWWVRSGWLCRRVKWIGPCWLSDLKVNRKKLCLQRTKKHFPNLAFIF